ncbi:hypothetical protein TWF696_005768 [Orbilia brochopaga]|uniref:BTB domain-containing protein n=1 Tax=Orbilia brochopaga TaxID=3140254 RepID=A0AAV9UX91_9PEZI
MASKLITRTLKTPKSSISLHLQERLDLVTTGDLAVHVPTPDCIDYEGLNSHTGVRQWRCCDAIQVCIDGKVYKLWEALYRHSPIFRGLIKLEERDVERAIPLRYSLTSSFLWKWMSRMIEDGFVEQSDVDALPELMLRDVVPDPCADTDEESDDDW